MTEANPGHSDAVPAIAAQMTITAGRGPNAFNLAVELQLDEGILVLYGPSGAGKSLTVKALAGLIRPRSGRIVAGGRVLFDAAAGVLVKPRHRGIGYVPQHNSLFPFRDVASNVAFGLPWRERRSDNPAVVAILEEFGIDHLARARPESLSGGERQKVALARALVVKPRLMLLDEPFAAVDRAGRMALRGLLRETLARHKTPAVFVTHSPEEALQLGDQMVRFEKGRSVACGPPAELLGVDAPIVVEGVVRGHRTAGPGQTAVTLDAVEVTGPGELLTADAEGRLKLVLRRIGRRAADDVRRPPEV